jgi:hypothetical protein
MSGVVVLSDADGSVSRTIAALCAERGLRPVSKLADCGDGRVLAYLASPRESVPWSQLIGVLVNRYRGNALLTRKSRLARLLRGYAQHPATFMLSPPAVLAPQTGACVKETPTRVRIAEDKRHALALEDECERQALQEADAAHPGYWIVKDAQGAKGSNIHVCGSAQEVRYARTPPSNVALLIPPSHRLACTECWSQAEAEVDSGRHSTLAVVQAYLSNPYLLPGRRKFDMRVWVLIDPAFRVYAHRQGVCRTSSVPYVKDDLSNTLSHITNHCIQEGAQCFGEHEPVRIWPSSCGAFVATFPSSWPRAKLYSILAWPSSLLAWQHWPPHTDGSCHTSCAKAESATGTGMRNVLGACTSLPQIPAGRFQALLSKAAFRHAVRTIPAPWARISFSV